MTGGWSCGEPEGREGVDDDGRTEGDQQDRMRIVGQCHVMRCCFLPAFSHCPQKPAFNCRWPSTKQKKYEYVGLRRPRWSMSTARLNEDIDASHFVPSPESTTKKKRVFPSHQPNSPIPMASFIINANG